MPRQPRIDVGGLIYHVLNRGNGRQELFFKPADYDAFLKVLREGTERYPVDVLALCLMPNHWHLVLRPREDAALSGYMRWVGVTHVRRHHQHNATAAGGHLYQGRYKSFVVQDDRHFLLVCRYVESNASRAGLAAKAEYWRWSSASAERGEHWPPLAEWPVPAPRNWSAILNRDLEPEEAKLVQQSLVRGRPLGEEAWVNRIAKRFDLASTLRPIGRPRKTTP
jgi:putative transposase